MVPTVFNNWKIFRFLHTLKNKNKNKPLEKKKKYKISIVFRKKLFLLSIQIIFKLCVRQIPMNIVKYFLHFQDGLV